VWSATKVDIRNERSQAAVANWARSGGRTPARHANMDGHIRDTVVFSILDSEWPPSGFTCSNALRSGGLVRAG